MPSQTGSIDLASQTLAAQTATNYITADSSGIKIHMSGNSTTYQHQTSDSTTFYVEGKKRSEVGADGLKVYVGADETEMASFGAVTRIGKAYVDNATNNESHMELDYHSLQLIDKEGNSYFHVSDLRDSDGNIAETRYGDGVATVFSTNFRILALRYVLVDGVTVDATYRLQQMHVTLSSAPADGSIVEIVYLPDLDKQVKAYTLGTRASDIRPGPMSVTLGSNVYAIGTTSVAEGTESAAIGEYSHAEGYQSKAYGNISHVEGYQSKTHGSGSHAEGHSTDAKGAASHTEGDNTIANGDYSHAEGYYTRAYGDYTHAQNYQTFAGYDYQTIIGKFNNNQSNNIFEIGNGDDNNNPSNAFTVNWNGIPSHCNPAGTFGSVFDLIYPIGAIYISTVSTDPSTLFGGTWERITGRFLLAATDGGAAGGNSNAAIAAGNTGGEATHTLTPAETATKDHSHTMNHGHGFTQPTITVKRTQAASSGSATYVPASNGANSVTNVASASGGAVTNYTGNTGGQTAANGSAHNNMPPYLAVYVWKRTA